MRYRNLTDAPAAYVLGFARNQANYVNSQVYEIQYPEMPLSQLIPINTSIPEWAAGMDTYFMDKVGAADWITGWSKDIPMADAKMGMVTQQFAMFGVGYQWNIEELGKANYQGVPLSSQKASAATFAAALFEWNRMLGVAPDAKGWKGLINHAAITPVAVPNDGTGSALAWFDNAGVGLKTPAQIVRDLNLALIGEPGPQRMVKDTLLMPDKALDWLNATPYGASSPNLNIMQYFMLNNEYKLQTGRDVTVRSIDQLKTAATTGVVGGGRLIGYRNSADVLEYPIPMPYRFLEVYRDGPLNYVVPGIQRVGAVDIKRGNGVSYYDGITLAP